MKKVNDFIGNKTQVKLLCDWLNSFYHEPTKEVKGYAIVCGQPGNGKTLLAQLIANSFEVELFTITPLDTNINDIVKSLNMKTLDGGEHKLILIDDIDEFPLYLKRQLYDLYTISNHPIIYTSKDLFLLSKEFISEGLFIRIKKPLTTEIYDHLRTISKLPVETLMDIAKKSKSVRSAILSTQNEVVNDLTHPTQSNYDVLKNAKARSLTGNLDRGKIAYLFGCIKGYDANALKVRMRFADFDYRTKVKFEEIDSFFINQMVEPIEKVLEYQKFEKKNANKKTTVLKKLVDDVKTKKKQKHPTLDDFL